MCSEKTRVLAAWCVASQAFRSVPPVELEIIFEVAELKRGSLMRRLAKAVLVTGGVDLRTVT
jgi:hypothetical protein